MSSSASLSLCFILNQFKIIKFNSITRKIFSVTLLRATLFRLFFSFYLLGEGELCLEWEAGSINSRKIILLIVLDYISLFFFSLVALISGRVLWFRRRYISSDKFYSRFILLVISFVLRMWLLIFSPNLIRILLGWDGLGVTSYLLVIYYQREKSFNAGIITALTNRLGDVAILITIGVCYQLGSWSYIYNRRTTNIWPTLVILILVIASITKRAQIPFSSWLPAAMAAPTPVSALVHSSTLVTAGVYLLIRLNYILEFSGLREYVIILGAVTITMAGMAALKELDIKKVVALSTLRQLGVIFFALGLSLPSVAFFHLVSHAYFKAILFIAAGSTIHSINDYQDIRTMGGGRSSIPVSVRVVLVARISLIGLPFIRGFYSKDLILEVMMMGSFNLIIFGFSILATAFTVLYSWRFFRLVFVQRYEGGRYINLTEADGCIIAGIIFLIAPTIVGGLIISWRLISYDALIFLPSWLKLFILRLISSRVLLGWSLRKEEWKIKRLKHILFNFSHYMWFIPFMFRSARSYNSLTFRKRFFKVSDQAWTPFVSFIYWRGVLIKSRGRRAQLFKRRFIKRLILVLMIRGVLVI